MGRICSSLLLCLYSVTHTEETALNIPNTCLQAQIPDNFQHAFVHQHIRCFMGVDICNNYGYIQVRRYLKPLFKVNITTVLLKSMIGMMTYIFIKACMD